MKDHSKSRVSSSDIIRGLSESQIPAWEELGTEDLPDGALEAEDWLIKDIWEGWRRGEPPALAMLKRPTLEAMIQLVEDGRHSIREMIARAYARGAVRALLEIDRVLGGDDE